MYPAKNIVLIFRSHHSGTLLKNLLFVVNIIKLKKGVHPCIAMGVLSHVQDIRNFLLMAGLKFFQGHISHPSQTKKDQIY